MGQSKKGKLIPEISCFHVRRVVFLSMHVSRQAELTKSVREGRSIATLREGNIERHHCWLSKMISPLKS